MELALSLGDSSKPLQSLPKAKKMASNMDLGFTMGVAPTSSNEDEEIRDHQEESRFSSDPPLQLDLLCSSAVPHHQPSKTRLPWLTTSLMSTPYSSDGRGNIYEVNRLKRKPLAVVEEAEEGGEQSSPNSTSSSFPNIDFSNCNKSFNRSSKRSWDNRDTDARANFNESETEAIRGGAGGSDDEENGLTRKKLRLSKEQSAFLEESFKEHNTLTPKQKLALAKELNLRPRQVEVWFQNRRARTKLKQTEVDCEYLKRCCETLTEENRRLQKELQELRALKTSQPFFMQLPATTLTMCPSCERVTSTTTNTSPAATCKPTATTSGTTTNSTAFELTNKSRLLPFLAHAQAHVHHARGHQTAS